MTDKVKQGLVKKQIWACDELAQAAELLDLCNDYEGLSLKLSLAMLRSRAGKETNDFLYYADNKLVGLLTLDEMGSEDKEVVGMVHPDYRRRGIGSGLLEAAKDEAKRRGIERFVLICERFSPTGQGFIAAVGAKYDFSEHKMVLIDFKQGGPYQERIRLYKARAEDIEVISQITAFSFGLTVEGTRRHITESITDPYSQYYLSKLGDVTVGCFNLFADDKEYSIYSFGVLPQYRRRGFGRQMLEQVIIDVRSRSQKRIALEVETENTNALGLYRSSGFREITTYGYYNLDIL